MLVCIYVGFQMYVEREQKNRIVKNCIYDK